MPDTLEGMTLRLTELGRYESALTLVCSWSRPASHAHSSLTQRIFTAMTAHCVSLHLTGGAPIQDWSQDQGGTDSQWTGPLGSIQPEEDAYFSSPPCPTGGGAQGRGRLSARLPSQRVDSLAALAWLQLRCFVNKFGVCELKVPLMTTVARTILQQSDMHLPAWLVQAFMGQRASGDGSASGRKLNAGDPAALLRAYLEFNRLFEAATFAIQLLQTSHLQTLPTLQQHQHCAVWLPHGLFESLREALTRSNNDKRLSGLGRSLNNLLSHHEASVAKESRMLIAC